MLTEGLNGMVGRMSAIGRKQTLLFVLSPRAPFAMPLFRCFIRGENFPGKLVGKREPIGFYTTRFVDAQTPEQAEMLALDLLRNDKDLEVPPEHRTQDAKVYVEKIEEVSSEAERRPNKGFTFFTMDG